MERTAMRTRPTRVGYSIRISSVQAMTAAAALLSFASAQPATAAWEGSTAQKIVSTGTDVAIVRPLAAVRAGLGAMLLVPASILASPACLVNLFTGDDCLPVFEAPYEVLVADPVEYAFRREMGEL